MKSMTTRIAIVTGAASVGIGRGIALRLAEVGGVRNNPANEHLIYGFLCYQDGLDVAINDLQEKSEQLEGLAKEIREKGRRCITFCGDVSEEANVKALVDKVVAELGGLDVVRFFHS